MLAKIVKVQKTTTIASKHSTKPYAIPHIYIVLLCVCVSLLGAIACNQSGGNSTGQPTSASSVIAPAMTATNSAPPPADSPTPPPSPTADVCALTPTPDWSKTDYGWINCEYAHFSPAGVYTVPVPGELGYAYLPYLPPQWGWTDPRTGEYIGLGDPPVPSDYGALGGAAALAAVPDYIPVPAEVVTTPTDNTFALYLPGAGVAPYSPLVELTYYVPDGAALDENAVFVFYRQALTEAGWVASSRVGEVYAERAAPAQKLHISIYPFAPPSTVQVPVGINWTRSTGPGVIEPVYLIQAARSGFVVHVALCADDDPYQGVNDPANYVRRTNCYDTPVQ